jgi:peptide/nickel transport system substrate-binding protein
MLGPVPRRAALLVALVLACAPEVFAQGLQANVPPGIRREVRIGIPGLPAVLDPAMAIEGAIPLVLRQVFDTLVAYREGTTDVEPALATRWNVSRDGLVWSFTLRDGVKFHDGAPLTAPEAAASFERLMRAEAGPPAAWASLFRGTPGVVKEVRAPDARTIQIVLVQPYAPLLTALAHPALGLARGSDPARPIGTGPYRVVDATAGRLALEAVPGHWAGPQKSERLVLLDVATDDEAEAELDAKTLDIWFPAAPPRRVEGALSVPGLRVGYLAFQTEKEPFSRKKVRQAVAAALDPAVIGVELERAAVPVQSFLPPGVWARREGSPILGGSPETVKMLLAAGGGWPNGFRATLLVLAETAPVDLPKLAEVLELVLGAAEIPVEVRVEAADVARAAAQKGEHDLALVEAPVVGGDPHLFLFPLSTSEAAMKGPRALNFSFYRNGKLDDVLIRASQLAFRPERQRLYRRAQAVLAEELPWIPIYVRLHWALVRADVRGLRLHPTGFHRLDTVTLEVAPGGPR